MAQQGSRQTQQIADGLPLFRSMKSYLYIAVRNQSFQYCEHQEVRNKYREFVLSRKGRTQDSNPQEEMEYQELRHLIDSG